MSMDLPTGDWPARSEAVVADWPTVPGYEILHELGRGGMGVVYKARQVSLRRLVALKLMRDGALANAEEQARFRIEAEAAARMQHPNIVAIYEIGEHAGRPYFAMELVEGGSLDKHLDGQPKPSPLAAELVRIVALAVQHAHAQKIVHRDLKPANILLSVPNTAGSQDNKKDSSSVFVPHGTIPKITDFGLAKRLDSDSTALTRDGAILGTVGYMAPEQAAGRGHEVGPAADVYALGAILYELLTGRPPFQADSWNQTMQQVLNEEPTPPSRLHPQIPRDLETICLKSLEKEPGRRYATAGEMADDLGRFLTGRPVAAVPLGARERLERLARRHGYQIVAEIGRGPQSIVYHVLEGPLKQAIALKVYAAGICTQEQWEAWLQHAAGLSPGLSHPHIVPLRWAGWWDGMPCLTLEYAPHSSLAGKLNGRPYAVSEALLLIERITEVVSYLHRQGIIHGNLKPTNVLLAADGIPRVTDWHWTGGIFRSATNHEATVLRYRPPESIRDPNAEPRPYTDIYGLGAILYELLTGQPPFAGANPQEAAENVRSQEPIPPSRLNPKVTPELEGCCLRCLHKNPWRRYHRAYDLLMRLRFLRKNPEG